MSVNRVRELPERPWRLRLEVDEPGSRVSVAIDEQGSIIGLATAGVPRDQDPTTRWELYSINIVAQRQGGGVADDLLRTTLGRSDTSVWVLADNARAQGFYRRHGFKIDGATRAYEGTGAPEVRMILRAAQE